MAASKKTLKRKSLRHAEYYNQTEALDGLYEKSRQGKVFDSLMPIISSRDNILEAYREIKRNTGGFTAGTDGLTIRDIERLPADEYVCCIQKKLDWYTPRPVRRVDIPKPNGKTRPLGIPSIWDRLVQQCILQILEPICEARFHERSNGFRPNRSAEHAIAQAMRMIQVQDLHYVVDIDIEGFFDNVNHAKLRKQMWSLGIRDKSLLCVITKMLKAPIEMPDGSTIKPDKGTPQGGVLSPLLSNIVLNELDWWIASQWETMPMPNVPPNYNPNGGRNRGNENKAMRKTTRLKEMYLVRYADDFKIFCRNRTDAERAYIATKAWLWERLKLTVNSDKSKVVNLKKSYTEFLGFKLKAVPNRGNYKVRSHMSDAAAEKTHKQLKDMLKCLQHPSNDREAHKAINRFNSTVIGKHQYFQIATCVYEDFDRIAWGINKAMKTRLKERLKRHGRCREGYIKDTYGMSAQMRFVDGYPLVPIAYIKTKNALHMKRGTCNYTEDGRSLIHKPLGVDLSILRELMLEDWKNHPVEYVDNRISLYAAQYGKCRVMGWHLEKDEIHCHHKTPRRYGGDDRYENLIIIHKDVHRLIHAANTNSISQLMSQINPDEKQLKRINKLRLLAHMPTISE